MTKIEEALDSILALVVRFPLTLFRLIFLPSKAFDPSANCSPGAFVIVVLLLLYVIQQAGASSSGSALPKWIDKDLVLAVGLTYCAILATIQRLLLSKMFIIGRSPDEQVRALFFPLGVFFLSLSLALAARALNDKQHGSATWIHAGFGHALYFLVVFNTARSFFALPARKAIVAAVVCHGVLILLGAFFTLAYVLASGSAA